MLWNWWLIELFIYLLWNFIILLGMHSGSVVMHISKNIYGFLCKFNLITFDHACFRGKIQDVILDFDWLTLIRPNRQSHWEYANDLDRQHLKELMQNETFLKNLNFIIREGIAIDRQRFSRVTYLEDF